MYTLWPFSINWINQHHHHHHHWLGREFRDFLNSLDDLHEYLRLSYPRLRPPSYFCDNESQHGLILHYRTKRNFLLWYTVGQIIQVAKVFYSTDVEIELLSEKQEINEFHFILKLRFDNQAFLQRPLNRLLGHEEKPIFERHERRCASAMWYADLHSTSGNVGCPFKKSFDINPIPGLFVNDFPPVTMETFLDIFPFSIIYDSSMTIQKTGNCLQVWIQCQWKTFN